MDSQEFSLLERAIGEERAQLYLSLPPEHQRKMLEIEAKLWVRKRAERVESLRELRAQGVHVSPRNLDPLMLPQPMQEMVLAELKKAP